MPWQRLIVANPLSLLSRLSNANVCPLASCGLQAIDNFRPTHRLLEKPLRMPVTDVLRR